VSVSWTVVAGGSPLWELTKESGRVPLCGDPSRCGCCRGLSWNQDLRRAYVVMADATRQKHAFGLLTRESFAVAVEVFRLYTLVVQPGVGFNEWGQCRGSVFMSFEMGGWSHPYCCECRAGGLCAACAGLAAGKRRFLVQDSFCGTFPSAEAPWFTGVTDTLKHYSGGCIWLCCPFIFGYTHR
jgi:hypothetical protein